MHSRTFCHSVHHNARWHWATPQQLPWGYRGRGHRPPGKNTVLGFKPKDSGPSGNGRVTSHALSVLGLDDPVSRKGGN